MRNPILRWVAGVWIFLLQGVPTAAAQGTAMDVELSRIATREISARTRGKAGIPAGLPSR